MADRWIGNDYYYIVFENGTHHLYKSWLCDQEPELVCTGFFEDCIKRMDDIDVSYQESIIG